MFCVALLSRAPSFKLIKHGKNGTSKSPYFHNDLCCLFLYIFQTNQTWTKIATDIKMNFLISTKYVVSLFVHLQSNMTLTTMGPKGYKSLVPFCCLLLLNINCTRGP